MASRNEFQPPGTSAAAAIKRRRHWQIRQMTGGRCFYCGNPTVHQGHHVGGRDWLLLGARFKMVREHVIPTSRAGDHKRSNFVPACFGCNTEKGSFTIDEYRLLKSFRRRDMHFRFAGEYGPPHRPRDWIVCHSDSFEKAMVVHNRPSAADGYDLRQRGVHGYHPEPRVRPVQQ